MTASRRGWLLTALLAVLVVVATVVLVRLVGAGGAVAATGGVDGTTPAVAGARVESATLKRSALEAAAEQGARDGATVVDAGIISVTSTDATVLLFADVPAAGRGPASLRRVVVTLRRDGDGWRLTGDRAV